MSASPPSRLILVGGGARSGKSAFALERARELGARRVFIATAQPLDGEMRARIDRHRAERGADFRTVEEPVALAEALRGPAAAGADVVVVDCLTLWLSNLLVGGESESAIAARVEEVAAAARERRFHTLLVTNEVGLGIVPESPLARAFRDVAGRTHQRLARAADEIYLAALGTILRIRPAPVEEVSPGGSA